MTTSTFCFRKGLLLLLGLSISAAQDIRTVPFSECEPQFEHGGVIFSGCTTLSMGGEYWCKLRNPPPGAKKWAFCDVTSFPPRQAMVSPRTTAPCAVESPIGLQGASVMGCYKKAAGEPFLCNVANLGPKPCVAPLSGAGDFGPGSLGANGFATDAGRRRTASSTGRGETDDSLLPSSSEGVAPPEGAKAMSGGAIAAIVVSTILILAGIAAAIFYFRQARQSKRVKPSLTRVKIDSSYGGSVPTERATKRSSSQYALPTLTEEDFEYDDSQYFDQEPIGRFVVTSTYANAMPDELVVKRGDTVELYQEFDDGWGAAINISRGNKKGVFPLHCIDEN